MPGGMPSAEQIAEMQKQMGGGAAPKLPDAPPPGAFSAPPKLPGLPSGLPGLGAPKLPGLGGLSSFNPFGKKK
jgi:signal recognition particle subunit SRP54